MELKSCIKSPLRIAGFGFRLIVNDSKYTIDFGGSLTAMVTFTAETGSISIVTIAN